MIARRRMGQSGAKLLFIPYLGPPSSVLGRRQTSNDFDAELHVGSCRGCRAREHQRGERYASMTQWSNAAPLARNDARLDDSIFQTHVTVLAFRHEQFRGVEASEMCLVNGRYFCCCICRDCRDTDGVGEAVQKAIHVGVLTSMCILLPKIVADLLFVISFL